MERRAPARPARQRVSFAAKLGWKPGLAAVTLDAPDGLALPPGEGEALLWLGFAADRASLASLWPRLHGLYRPGGRLWIAYPKKSGRLRSDLDRDHGWEPLSARLFLPVSQVSVDADWSALRFRPRAEIPRLTRRF